MTDQQIEDLANRLIAAIEHLAPGALPWYAPWAAFGSYVAVVAAVVAFWVGWLNLKHQQNALTVSTRNEDRSEWWKRAQWALEVAVTMETPQLAAAANAILTALVKSDMASDTDKDLLDTAWKAGTGALNQETAEQAIARAAAFANEADLDDGAQTGENEGEKEDENG